LKQKDKTYKRIMAAMLPAYIVILLVFNIIASDRTFSEMENRVLEQAPSFNIGQLLHGNFTTNYEKYIADQFAFRDFWIGVKSYSERILGKKDSNGVYLGRDGYLLQNFNKPKEEDFKNNIDIINSFSSSIPEANKYFMLVPNAVEILKDKLPPYAPASNQLEFINKVNESLSTDIRFIDVYDALYSNKDDYIFYKTDHHWTTKGAYYGYKEMGNTMGFIPRKESDFNIEQVTDSFFGSLYSKSGFKNIAPDTINLYIPKSKEEYNIDFYETNNPTTSLYSMDNINKKDKYTIFLGGNHPIIKIATNSNSKEKLLIIKDSYANSIVPFLTGHYGEIYMVDLRYYDGNLKEFIKSNSIDNVLFLYNVNTFFEDKSIENLM